jgi:very-short-patch-repair endonuclease
MLPSDKNEVLIALLRRPQDWRIVEKYGIYRVRGTLRHPPPIMEENRVKWLGFYLPAAFGQHKFSIRHYVEVRKMSHARRYECVPDEPRNPKSDDIYYKFDVSEPQLLEEPIVCLRHRKYMVLIPTTEQKFFSPKVPEINFCYNTSRLEEKMWDALLERNIYPERQYAVKTKDDEHCILDFAIFCNKDSFFIEVDGPHHEEKNVVRGDKWRDNKLSVVGWDGFRYTPKDLEPDRINQVMEQIEDKVQKLDGQESANGILPKLPPNPNLLFPEEHLSFF